MNRIAWFLLAFCVSPASLAALCGFDDPTGPDYLCEVSFDGSWQNLGGQPNRTNVLGTRTPSGLNSFYNNFSEPVGINFNSVRDLESAYFASRGTPLLTILGYLGGVQVADRTIDFRPDLGGSGFFVFELYTFDSSFDRIDALEFRGTTFGFPAGFGEFFMDDATINASAVPEPALLALMISGIAGLIWARRRKRLTA